MTDPGNMFLADNADWSRCHISSTSSARSLVVHYTLLTESYYKSVTYHRISYW